MGEAGSWRANPPMARPEAEPTKNAGDGIIVNYGETIYNREPLESCHCQFVKICQFMNICRSQIVNNFTVWL